MPPRKRELTPKEIKKLYSLFEKVITDNILFGEIYQEFRGKTAETAINQHFKEWCYENKKKRFIKYE
jgi:hypothetical protein